MPALHIEFNRIKDKKPEQDQQVVWIKEHYSFEMVGVIFQSVEAELSWTELDSEGSPTGTSCSYESDEDFDDAEMPWKLDVIFDGNIADDNTLWCSEEDYFSAIEKMNDGI